MKKWSPFRSLFLAAVVACVGWLFFSLNGCIGLIWTAFVEEDETVYAAGYSDFRFRLVRKGDTPSQVMLKLGSPLVTIEETTVAVFSRLFPIRQWLHAVSRTEGNTSDGSIRQRRTMVVTHFARLSF